MIERGENVYRIFISFILLVVITSMTACSKEGSEAYGSEEAIKKGDVVFQNEVSNFERFEQFLNNVANKKEDTIRVTGYTIEGEPIYQDLQFDGQEIQYKYDNTNDKYGEQDGGIKNDVCSKIIDRESGNGQIEYLVSGCSNNLEHFLLRTKKKTNGF